MIGLTMDVVGFGSLNVDMIYKVADPRVVNGVKPGGETEGDKHSFEKILGFVRRIGVSCGVWGGGSAANTMVALSRLGFRTGVVGRVGSDANADFILKELESEGVDTGGVKRGPGESGVCLTLVDRDGERTLYVVPNANSLLSYEDLDLDYLFDAKVLHLTSFVGTNPLEAQLRVVKQAPKDLCISFDPGEIYARLGLEAVMDIIERCSIVFLTGGELGVLTGSRYPGGVDVLLEHVDLVVCKFGSRGSRIHFRGGAVDIPAVEVVSMVDTTGAGDVFNAGFLAGFLRGESLERCGKIASRAAALSLAGFGRSSYPGREVLGVCG